MHEIPVILETPFARISLNMQNLHLEIWDFMERFLLKIQQRRWFSSRHGSDERKFKIHNKASTVKTKKLSHVGLRTCFVDGVRKPLRLKEESWKGLHLKITRKIAVFWKFLTQNQIHNDKFLKLKLFHPIFPIFPSFPSNLSSKSIKTTQNISHRWRQHKFPPRSHEKSCNCSLFRDFSDDFKWFLLSTALGQNGFTMCKEF